MTSAGAGWLALFFDTWPKLSTLRTPASWFLTPSSSSTALGFEFDSSATGTVRQSTVSSARCSPPPLACPKAGFTISFDSPTFNEFVVEFPDGFETTYKRLVEKKIVAGLPLAPYYPALANHYVLCVTETSSKADMDELVKEVQS